LVVPSAAGCISRGPPASDISGCSSLSADWSPEPAVVVGAGVSVPLVGAIAGVEATGLERSASVVARTPSPKKTTATTAHVRIFMFTPSSAGRRSDRALDLHRPVVHLFQRVGVAGLDLDVATLLGDHVQQRNPAELVALPDHVQVLTGHL